MTPLPGRQPAGSVPAHPTVATAPASSPARRGSRGRSGPPPVRISGRFFELTGFAARTSQSEARSPLGSRSSQAGPQPAAPGTHTVRATYPLQISVPKRLVRAAVRRNTVKRVAREAWRAGPAVLQTCGRTWRLRLKAHPLGSLAARSQHARAQMRTQARRQPATAVPPSAVLPGFADIKRQLRAELDQLLADAARCLNRRQATGSRPSDGGSPSDGSRQPAGPAAGRPGTSPAPV